MPVHGHIIRRLGRAHKPTHAVDPSPLVGEGAFGHEAGQHVQWRGEGHQRPLPTGRGTANPRAGWGEKHAILDLISYEGQTLLPSFGAHGAHHAKQAVGREDDTLGHSGSGKR